MAQVPENRGRMSFARHSTRTLVCQLYSLSTLPSSSPILFYLAITITHMPLHPNIHLLIPSGASNLIETRLYLPAAATSTTDFITTSSQSTPRSLAELGQSGRDAVRNLGITKVVTAAHPWARLGGNMMFP
jgi:hypothetical protein